MRRTAVISVLLCACASFALGAAPSVVARIDEATVYYRGATLHYSASAALEKGSGSLEITGLPPSIDRASLKVQAGSGVLISAAEFASGRFKDPDALKRVAAMRDSLLLLQKQVQESGNRLEIAQKMLSLLTEGIENNLKGRTGGTSATELTANLELYRRNAATYYKNIDDEQEKFDRLSAREEALSARIKEAEAAADKPCGVLKIAYSAPAAATVRFNLSLYTTAAGWTPVYEVNVPSTDKPVSLTARGQVRQNTGLDWKALRLHLSSGRPDRTNIAPAVEPWKLGFRSIMVRGSQMMMAKSAAREESVMDDYVEVSDAGLETCYDISLPYDIAGDGAVAGIELKHYSLPAKYMHFAAPRQSSQVFLTAVIDGWDNYRLLPGQATVSYAGAYAGKTSLGSAQADGSIRLTLGVDPAVTVTRERSEEMKAPAAIGNNVTVSCGWRTVIRNGSGKTISLQVKDQIPVSTEKEIEVKNVRLLPESGALNAESGIISWEFSLAGGQAQETVVSYKVKYPSDKPLNGIL
ncbi:MAG: DUF4139 domain-containing protein [Bacteroidales bacterium]|nr:DUF4139 domain-containing protein [Bacteroidales bacterium]